MRCPHCSNQDSKVIESRDASESGAIRRRRECLKCGHRYTTYERVERPNLAIVKKDGNRELFDRNKLFAAIHRSVGKFLSRLTLLFQKLKINCTSRVTRNYHQKLLVT